MPQKKLEAFFKKKKGTKRKNEDLETPAAKKTKLTPAQKDRILGNKRAALKKLKNNGRVNFTNLELVLEPTWKEKLKGEFEKEYFKTLKTKLKKEVDKNTTIFPPAEQVYRAFELCPWDKLKVLILGQDPYHNVNQAEGLCFSVCKGQKYPPSLRNMYKEAAEDVDFVDPKHGSLVQWAEQGVLLLNTVLTVKAHNANSHKAFGWQNFTDAVIKLISKEHDGVVFVLWGGQAKKKIKMIDKKKHRIISSAHPSPLSSYRGYFGSKPYSKVNGLLAELGKEPINWQIDP